MAEAMSTPYLVKYPTAKAGGFYAVADVGSFRANVFFPNARMLIAAFTSLSISAPQSQLCQRSSSVFLRTVPHLEQIWDVYLGFTFSMQRPAPSALTLHICMNMPHPASKILLESPPLAAAPLGRYFPCSSCLGLGRLIRLPTWISSNTMTW